MGEANGFAIRACDAIEEDADQTVFVVGAKNVFGDSVVVCYVWSHVVGVESDLVC